MTGPEDNNEDDDEDNDEDVLQYNEEQNRRAMIRIELDKSKLDIKFAKLQAASAEYKLIRGIRFTKKDVLVTTNMIVDHILEDMKPIVLEGIFKRPNSRKRSFEEYQRNSTDEMFELIKASRDTI